MRVSRQLSSMGLLLQLFLLCLILSFACPKCKKRNHQIKNCVILDLLIDFNFVHKPFSKVANWPSSCVMLQYASNSLANTGTIPIGMEAWCSMWTFFPEVAIHLNHPSQKTQGIVRTYAWGARGFFWPLTLFSFKINFGLFKNRKDLLILAEQNACFSSDFRIHIW